MKTVDYKVEGRIAHIVLSRPEKRNAMNEEMILALQKAFDHADADAQVKVVILEAEGDVFCAGADLAYLQKLQSFSFEDNLRDSHELKELYLKMYNLSKVIVACVQGHALAGGCGLVTVCDFVFASSSARFGYTEVRIGFVPALVMPFLIRRVGESHARDLLLSGRLISADEALSMGLVHYVRDKENIGEEVNRFVTTLVNDNSGESMATTRRLIAASQDLSIDEALRRAEEANARARATEDCKRGIAAFLNKERVLW